MRLTLAQWASPSFSGFSAVRHTAKHTREMTRNIALIFLTVTAASVVGADIIQCTTAGFMCRTQCTELVRCTPDSNSTTTFREQVVRKCPGTINNYCNVSTLDCSGSSCQDADLYKAEPTCHEDGIYPHPTKCNEYYGCSNSLIIKYLCPNATSYNATTHNCSSNANARSCIEGPIPKCQSITDIGAYPESPEVFYVCAYDAHGYLRPEMHRCVQGFVFDGEVTRCVVPSSATTAALSATLLAVVFLTVAETLGRQIHK